jgi:energy-coupling factor transporter ATP-binding protein EcfA2
MMLDEPGANLDPDGKRWLEATVRELADDGTTIIVATNDEHEMTWGTRRVELVG